MAWATVDELAAWMPAELPADAERMLTRASELITYVTRFAVYDVDTDDEPTDTTVLAALRDATCAQVEYWAEVGEDEDVGGSVQGISLGPLQVQYGAGDNRVTPTFLAPRAQRILSNAGLLDTLVNTDAAVLW